MKRAGSRKAAASSGIFLTGVRRADGRWEPDRFPLTLPIFRGLERIDFRARVTFLVGENGCGKSTLLEGLAAGTGAVAVGGRDLERDPTLAGARAWARAFRVQRARHPRVTLFLRAEDRRRVAHLCLRLKGLRDTDALTHAAEVEQREAHDRAERHA